MRENRMWSLKSYVHPDVAFRTLRRHLTRMHRRARTVKVTALQAPKYAFSFKLPTHIGAVWATVAMSVEALVT
jgi:hypothetical protein